jgi:hypothetical protein
MGGPSWSCSVGVSHEGTKKRCGLGKASGRMPCGSAEGATSGESGTSHSTPKGCAEDTGVLQCVMCWSLALDALVV